MPDVPAGSRRARAAETEVALKDAARREFARLGYLNTRVTDITSAAGRAAGSFYSHFASKEELLVALLADLQAEVDDRMGEHPGDHDLSDPGMLRAHVEAFWGTFRAHHVELVALQQAALVDTAFAERLRKLLTPEQEVIEAHLAFVASRGVDLPGPPALVAAAVTGLMGSFAYAQFAAGSAQIPDGDAVDLLSSFILRGIAGNQTNTSP